MEVTLAGMLAAMAHPVDLDDPEPTQHQEAQRHEPRGPLVELQATPAHTHAGGGMRRCCWPATAVHDYDDALYTAVTACHIPEPKCHGGRLAAGLRVLTIPKRAKQSLQVALFHHANQSSGNVSCFSNQHKAGAVQVICGCSAAHVQQAYALLV